jgi:hypothetical protein
MQYARKERTRRAEIRWQYRQTILVGVGNLTITWAGVERMLDQLIAHWQHLATDLSKEHPRSLSKKLEYLKTMQKDERLNEPVREFLRATRIIAKKLGNDRHDLIHGLLHNVGTSTNWRTQRIVYDGPYARIQHRHYSNDDLQHIIRTISDFANFLSPRIWVLIGGDRSRFPKTDELDQALREFGYG